MQEEFYRFKRVYISEKGESENFFDVLPKELTLHPVEWYNIPRPYRHHDTMFKEVSIKPYTPTKEISSFLHHLKSITPIDNNMWQTNVYETLKDIVYRAWRPKTFHVVAHSGGIDSRILSNIIIDLYEEHGGQWLGNILFVENGGEGDTFEEIMKIQGWNKSQYMVYNKECNPMDYHSYGLQSNVMAEKYNGSVGYPYNSFYDSYDDLTRQGVIPEGAQFFGGFGPYIENGLRGKNNMSFFIERDYYYQMHAFNLKGEWIFPWWNYRYFYEISKYKECRVMQRPRISDIINRSIMPDVPNVPHKDIEKKGYRTVSSSLMGRITKEYISSWYGKHIKTSSHSHIEYSKWWGQYCEASICEKLIRDGYKMKVT